MRAGPRLNRRAVGVLAKAQQLYGVEVHAFVMLGNHWHLSATYADPEQMAGFHCHLGTNLSKEVSLLRGWLGTVFPERYHHVEVSEEPEMQRQRLKYVLAQGCKEGLVASPLDWPGASTTASLVTGEPMIGEWIDRTALRRALDRGEKVSEKDFTEELELRLSPIPAMAHLSAEAYRREIRVLVREIEDETAAMHKVDGTRPLGVDKVKAQDPEERPDKVKKSPRPWFHARNPEVRRQIRQALVRIHEAYRKAAEELKEGNRNAAFPVHSFPPGLPFVRQGNEGDGSGGKVGSPKGGPKKGPGKVPALLREVELLEPG